MQNDRRLFLLLFSEIKQWQFIFPLSHEPYTQKNNT